MKKTVFLIVALASAVTGCGGENRSAPAQSNESGMGVGTTMGSEAYIRHMHAHASRLGTLNAALAAGDLEAARTPAYWLLRHEGVTGHPEGWQPHIDSMRDAARGVADAPDIDTARAAAQRIKKGCLGCHATAGINVDMANLKLD